MRMNKRNNCKKIRVVIMIGVMLTFVACGGKETMLLEEEDLVSIEGLPEEDAASEKTFEDSLQEGGETDTAEISQEQVEPSTLFVHICGEVMYPGVYELPKNSRIFEAVEAAGGFTDEASQSYVNLAQMLADGCRIEIPALGKEPTADDVWIDGAGIAEAGVSQGTLVNINTATKTELCLLPGIGESRADAIISYREKNNGFTKIEDIMKVEGIKEGMFEKMKDKICVRGER